MIKQYCITKFLLNQFIFYILYSISIILVVFVLFDVFTYINVPFYKSCMCGLTYICDLFQIQLPWDKCWICEMYMDVM
jgi:hypothetical protein